MNIMDIINIPAGYIIKFFNKIVGNQYLLALLIFSIFVEIVLLPFSIKQQKNSIKQAKMRPKEMAIRKKYAGREDQPTKQKMSMEIQEMYQKEGFNPMSGCLPLLIQFPIIIALYNIVLNPLRYICNLSTEAINGAINVVKSFPEYAETAFNATRNIDLMSAIKNVIDKHGIEAFSGVEGFSEHITSSADIPNLTIFGGAIDLSAIPSITTFNFLLLIPVLTFLAYFFSMKINKKLMYQPAQNDPAMGCSNKVMDYMMPLMSVFITFGVPAALGVYWIFKCIIGVIKQAIIHLFMPIPKLTDEELKAAEKEYNEKASKAPERPKSNQKVRSLHHIDDDDYEDITPKASEKKSESVEKEAEKTEDADKAEKTNNLLGGATMKEDNTAENMQSYREKFRKNKKDDDKN